MLKSDILYKDLDRQISQHLIFVDRISRLQNDRNLNNSTHSKELIVYLRMWLLNYVIVEDKKYQVNTQEVI